ncbi:MAG: ankyrin repeat domain-containing protein [Bdellovibrionales bacterium]|nr:ankyrin repeat domain-containing protein [Bdellovibrionales bacterium]
MKSFKSFLLNGILFLISLFVANLSFAENDKNFKDSFNKKNVDETFIFEDTDLHKVIIQAHSIENYLENNAKAEKEFLNHVLDLIEQGVDVNVRDSYGNTALDYATQYANEELLKLLLASGADVNSEIHGRTALHEATFYNSKGVAEILLASGADVNARDSYGNTPLHRTASFCNKEIAKLFLASGANVNARGSYGNTPLHELSTCFYEKYSDDRKAFAELLLASGAKINAKNNNGLTALHQASIYGNTAFAEFLIERGAEMNEPDQNGKTFSSLMLFIFIMKKLFYLL